MPSIKRGLVIFLTPIFLLLCVMLWRAYQLPSHQISVTPHQALSVDGDRAAARLAAAIRWRTIAKHDDAQHNVEQFYGLHQQLLNDYPDTHSHLTLEHVNDTALLFTWTGSDPSLAPLILMAHQDVVPIAEGTDNDWTHAPFAGVIADGFIWGRGAWDDKGNLIAQLEAVEALVAQGFQPRRTVYLVFGADEEVSGQRGAKAIADLLQTRGVKNAIVIDEGMLITHGMLPGLNAPAALIGVAEKGYMTAEITVNATPGHSSLPPTNGEDAIAQLSEILLKLRDAPLPARLDGVVGNMFDALAPEMAGINRIVFANRNLLAPLLSQQLALAPATDALQRTTTAFTMLNAGNKENVLPGRASATINFRLLPGDRAEDVLQHLHHHAHSIVPSDRVAIKPLEGVSEASPISSSEHESFGWIATAVRTNNTNVVVAPGLMLGAADARHFTAISNNIYRFSPIHATAEDLPRFHGTNERLSIANLVEMIQFYHHLIQLSNQTTQP